MLGRHKLEYKIQKRHKNNLELNEVAEFFSILPMFVSLSTNEDYLIGRSHNKGIYTVKTCYNTFMKEVNQPSYWSRSKSGSQKLL